MADKAATGIPGLDSMLGGGFPVSTMILLEAPPGSGKSTFCKQFIREGLDNGEPCIYIATSEPVSQLIAGLEALGARNLEKAYFIDAYSWRVPESTPRQAANVAVLPSLTELNELTRLVKKESERLGKGGCGSRLVLDSISDMLLYAEPASVFKFLQLFSGMVKGSCSSAVVVLEDGLHEPRHVSTINYICDGTIRLKLEGDRRSICVERMFNTVHPLKWLPCSLGKHGVEVRVEDFFR